MDGQDAGQLYILVNVKGDGSVLLWVQVEVNAGRIFLEVSHRFVVGYGDKSEPGQVAKCTGCKMINLQHSE